MPRDDTYVRYVISVRGVDRNQSTLSVGLAQRATLLINLQYGLQYRQTTGQQTTVQNTVQTTAKEG